MSDSEEQRLRAMDKELREQIAVLEETKLEGFNLRLLDDLLQKLVMKRVARKNVLQLLYKIEHERASLLTPRAEA